MGGQLEEQVDCRGVQERLLFPERMYLITNLFSNGDRETEANEQKITVSFTHTKDTVSKNSPVEVFRILTLKTLN